MVADAHPRLTLKRKDCIVAVSEHDRHKVHESRIAQLGESEADPLMEMLPRDGWENLATKPDLHLLRADINVFRADVDVFRADVDRKLAQNAAAFHRDMIRQTWILAGTLIAGLGSLGALLH